MKTKEELFTQRLRELWPDNPEEHKDSFGKSIKTYKGRVAQWMVLRTRFQWQFLLWSISLVIAAPICAAICILMHPMFLGAGIIPAMWLGSVILCRLEFGKWRWL